MLQRGAAERLQLQAGGGDDHVGVQMLAGFQCNAGGVEVIDVIGDHFRAAFVDRELYKSASGIRHSRWSHGLYRGLKWVSTS